jgi:formylglycine-generating enzyme required for sulfatase activity/tRNA A-37 threonylcarbamoyl transferase component Bud32
LADASSPLPPTQTPPATPVDELGVRLQSALGDAYTVEGRLGSGGFAVVFLVRDVHLKRKLAVKVLSPDVIASHSVLERFRREAETVAQLSHPHIVPLHFIGQKDDLVYLVMEAIDGGSLADRLTREGKLPIEEAARIFGEVASALAHAHKRGVVHRDIKPQNVLLDAESGRALVTDFGIARTAEGGSLTATGMVVGTPAYLSPEQVTGEPSDHRADIYALGVMMYEMVAGQPPFTGATPTAVLMKRLGGPPEPLRTIRAEVPAALEELVDACLATDPDERIQNAADIARALTGHSPVSGGHTTSTRLRVRKKTGMSKGKIATIATIGVVIVGAAIAALISKPDPPPAVAAAPTLDPGMVLIRAGTYMIGSNDPSYPAGAPAHAVELPAFAIDSHEVTVGTYRKFVDGGNAEAPWTTMPDSNLPVTRVKFAEAQNYCSWRGGARLPSEEEWEAAARGFAGRKYAWGSEWNPTAANVSTSGRGRPAPVGSFPAGRTPEGVHDLIGNVWEWTSSLYRPYNDAKAITGQYVIRGGAFNAVPTLSTAVSRIPYDPATSRANLAATGFRCAKSLPSPAATPPR